MGKLIIGVGGTGTKIVRAIQQRWDRVGNRPSDVVLAVIDARERTPEEGAIPGVTFYPNKPINFSNDFERFRGDVESWWPEMVKASSAINFGEGCGAIRAYGRYFAFRFAKTIIRTIDEATEELVDKHRNMGASRVAFSVIVVGSLGNGTGGGTLFDVATIARNRLSEKSDEVTCMGVFIPGAVTRKGNHGVLERRVAASGYASLLELQYEFNRADRSATPRPKHPYTFRGFDGIGFTEFSLGSSEDAAPFDSALLLDEKDRNGLTLTYPSLVHMAAEGVAMLIEGGDRDYRLVDSMTMISNQGAKRFGSFGAARLMVPGPELLKHATASHSLSTVRAAASADEAIWRDLLADETPGDVGKKLLRAEAVTINSSVDFFIEHILRIKETEKGNPKAGAAFNQIFDRFKSEDDAALSEFDQIIDDIDTLKDAKAIVSRAVHISSFVEDRTKKLSHDRGEVLLGSDSVSLWKRPRDPKEPDKVGIKWLINERVMEFIEAGAFGLLAAWLEELKKQIAVNRESITQYERATWLRDSTHKSIDLSKPVSELAREAEGFFRNLRLQELIKGVNMVRQEALHKFKFLLWETKVDAVEAFYDAVDPHVEKLRSAAAAIAEDLGSPEYTGRLDNDRESAEKVLDAPRDGRATAASGVKAEIPLGGDPEMRDALMVAIRATASASERGTLAGAVSNRTLFAHRISSDSKGLGWLDTVKTPVPASRLAADFVTELEKRVRERIEPIVMSQCSIDSVLETQAARLVDAYQRLRHEAGTRMRTRDLQDAKTALSNTAGSSALELIEQLKWDSDGKARDKAIELVIAGELARLIKFATPQWSLTPDVLKTVHVTAHQFVTYPEVARWIPRAIAHLDHSNEGSALLKAQPSPFGDPMRIDIVFVEVGADVEALRMTSELAAYRWAMQEERAFSPHLTQEYHEMGMELLERTGSRARQSDVLLALAEVYGIVKAERGEYRLTIEIKGKAIRKQMVHPTYGPNHSVGPRGIENVVAALDSEDPDSKKLLVALKTTVYDAMKNDAFGSDGARGVGWSGVADRLSSRAGKLRALVDKEKNPKVAEIVRRQADGLDQLAAEIADTDGRTAPKLFA